MAPRLAGGGGRACRLGDGIGQRPAAVRTLAEENNCLQRVRRVAPLLAQLTEAREGLAQLGDVPHLPPNAESRFQALVAVPSRRRPRR